MNDVELLGWIAIGTILTVVGIVFAMQNNFSIEYDERERERKKRGFPSDHERYNRRVTIVWLIFFLSGFLICLIMIAMIMSMSPNV